MDQISNSTMPSNGRRRIRPFRATQSMDFQAQQLTMNQSCRKTIRPSRSFDVSFLTRLQTPKETLDTSFQAELNHFQCSQQDVLSILQDDAAFRTLQASLRQRGRVTNGYLKENFHFYVQHVKAVREQAVTFQKTAEGNRDRANLHAIMRRKKMSAAA